MNILEIVDSVNQLLKEQGEYMPSVEQLEELFNNLNIPYYKIYNCYEMDVKPNLKENKYFRISYKESKLAYYIKGFFKV